MPAIARVGVDTVNGGLITGPGATSVLTNGSATSLLGDAVAPHAPFTGAHLTATIVTASGTVNAESKGVVRQGDSASCGHTVDSGSPDANAGG